MIQVLALCIVIVLGILMLRGIMRPGIMLALMWATHVIEQVVQQGLPGLLVRNWIINVALTLFTVAAVFRAFMADRYRGFVFSAAHLWIMALILICALSYFWSIAPEYTSDILSQTMPYVIAFVFVAPFCAFDQKQLESAVNVTVYFGGFVLIAMAFASIGSRGIVLETIRGKDIEANPLAAASFGGYVAICSVFSLYSRRSANVIVFSIRVGIALLGMYTIVRSGSRGQLVAVIVACFIWLPITARMAAKRSTILAYIFAITLAYASIRFIDNFNPGRWQLERLEQASSGRIEQAIYVIGKMWDAGPPAWLFGLGNSASYELIGSYPHFIPAEVLAEEGLLGFVCYMAFMITVTICGFKFMRQKDVNPQMRVNMGMLLTLFTFEFGLGMKQGSFLGSTLVLCFGLCIVVNTQLIRKKASSSRHSFGKQTFIMPKGNFPGST